MSERFGVIGAGILGLAIARRLLELVPDATVTVLEKERQVGFHQTGHNSGVVHAGLYYAPGSLKATLCRRGMTLLREYCAERGLPYDECGKLVVARDAGELARLDGIEARATANAVPGLRRLGGGELQEIEPHVAGVAALLKGRGLALTADAVEQRIKAGAIDMGAPGYDLDTGHGLVDALAALRAGRR